MGSVWGQQRSCGAYGMSMRLARRLWGLWNHEGVSKGAMCVCGVSMAAVEAPRGFYGISKGGCGVTTGSPRGAVGSLQGL